MGIIDRIGSIQRGIKEVFGPETAEKRKARISRRIENAALDIQENPTELGSFAERYGDLAGHALTVSKMTRGATADERRDINSAIASRFTEALRRSNWQQVEAGERLRLDIASDSVISPPEVDTYF